ncbi:vWA domain-containing protein [Arenimonas composti]|uniref:VWFA domain-containing protein n=1 Tax=Arenimonas composti TR7-09 = DSM 18010 TaxID=1121013 RepID=A0A091BBD6_9GAMM|nr:vWA domain-containing protein [Arenimonas composti]KFN48827.1 hypothetical protein P873_13525 [Arenimonas composti TR7-09 = DSM 18010]
MTDRSHITILLDRTGSMQDIRADVVGGFNAFLAAQQALPGQATLTLVQFDSQDPYEVIHAAAPLATVAPLTLEQYVPRASTPLYDAMGRGILDLELRLARLPEAERPRQVIFVVVTDGMENASREFRRDRVMALIEAKKKLGWDFVFLSADLGAFADAGDLGVVYESRLAFSKSARGSERAWAAASDKIGRRRGGAAAVVFDDQDRQAGDDTA